MLSCSQPWLPQLIVSHTIYPVLVQPEFILSFVQPKFV